MLCSWEQTGEQDGSVLWETRIERGGLFWEEIDLEIRKYLLVKEHFCEKKNKEDLHLILLLLLLFWQHNFIEFFFKH